VLLFFVTGLGLPSEAFASGLREVRLHLFVQAMIFVIVPLYFVATVGILGDQLHSGLIIGVLALAVLPTTVSSCVVFTQLAGGNVIATLYNAAIANTLGVFLTPVLLSLLLQQAGRPMPIEELLQVLASLGLQMVLPIAVGQLARLRLRTWATRHKRRLTISGNAVILLIVWMSLSKTAANPDLRANLAGLWQLLVYLAVSHIVLLGVAWFGARLLRLSKASTYTALFAAPQKTLAMGAPFLQTYFAGATGLLGITLVPLLFYHFWQLAIAGFLPRIIGPVAGGGSESAATKCQRSRDC
jgi:sodium/bile acid cotransporter 7